LSNRIGVWQNVTRGFRRAAGEKRGFMATAAAVAGTATRDSGREAPRERRSGELAEEIKALKARDNTTNWIYLGRIYFVIALAAAGAIWVDQAAFSGEISWWWSIPATFAAIIAIGASQHQFGGAVHEGTHYILFANRKLNELASDWLAAFPILTTTYHFRLHHLAHHQFVNDPERDPDISQLHDSDHWLDFPITHVEMLMKVVKQLWLPNLFRYMLTRARYSAMGQGNHHNPYAIPGRPPAIRPLRAGVLFAVGTPAIVIPLIVYGHNWLAAGALFGLWALVVTILALLPNDAYQHTRLDRVISHRLTAIGRVTHLAILFAAVSAVQMAGWGPAWTYFGILWVLPVMTTFPLFMILRQWVQHGNADRGRYTNTRVFLAGPMVRYAVFPWGMDYHLPHHMIASVPHYNLHKLHEVLLRDPQYREKGVIVEGYFGSDENDEGRPTALGVLGEKYAPKTREAIFVDTDALEHADVVDAEGLQREVEASLQKAP
jgi:fatty acid desaturase